MHERYFRTFELERSRDSIVSIANRLWAGLLKKFSLIPGRCNIFNTRIFTGACRPALEPLRCAFSRNKTVGVRI